MNAQKQAIESRLDQKDKTDKKEKQDLRFSTSDLTKNNEEKGLFSTLNQNMNNNPNKTRTLGRGGMEGLGSSMSDKNRLEDYDEAMRRIKNATGVSDVNEIIQKFATQHDTYNNLLELKATNEKKLLEMNDRKLELRSDVEKMRYEGLESMTRK